MTVRYITVSDLGEVFPITDLVDIHSRTTDDPTLAVSCVLRLPNGQWRALPTDEVPIYTVH